MVGFGLHLPPRLERTDERRKLLLHKRMKRTWVDTITYLTH